VTVGPTRVADRADIDEGRAQLLRGCVAPKQKYQESSDDADLIRELHLLPEVGNGTPGPRHQPQVRRCFIHSTKLEDFQEC
jgi:hypothetical protein